MKLEDLFKNNIIRGQTVKQETMMKHLKEMGGIVIADSRYVNNESEAYIGMKGNKYIAIYPDGTFETNKNYTQLGRNGWELKENLEKKMKINDLFENGYEGGIEWEDPGFKGGERITRTSGFGQQQAKAAKQKQMQEKLNATWAKLLQKLKAVSGEEKSGLIAQLKQLAAAAKQKGIELSPSPEKFLAPTESVSESIYGSNHFKDRKSALKYYRVHSSNKEEVDRKIEDGEIVIGKPKAKKGEKILLNKSEGRYFIEKK